jgi:hypothetical protein
MEAAGRFMIRKPQRGLLARFDHLNISIRFRRTGGPQALCQLRAHQALGIFRTQHMVMEIGNPLPAGNGQAQIFDALVEMHRDRVPKEFRIFVDEIGRRRIAELAVHADFFKFIKQRVDLLGVHGIAELPDQVGGLDQTGQDVCIRGFSLGQRWEPRTFNGFRNPLCVNARGFS